jgi:hypothetical protein
MMDAHSSGRAVPDDEDVVAQPAETYRGHGPSRTKVGIQSRMIDAACFFLFFFAYSGMFFFIVWCYRWCVGA